MRRLSEPQTILVGEDEPEVRGYFEMALRCPGYSVELAQDGDEVLSCLELWGSRVCAVLLDVMMPNRDGLDTLAEIRRIYPSLPVIIVSGIPSTANIVAAMKSGAADFLTKPVAHEDLRRAVARVLESRGMQYTPAKDTTPVVNTFVGANQRMKDIQSLIHQIGWSGAPVLIRGETGSGKEVVARDLHTHSRRANKPFLKLNCAALPSELVESELFGYERGAFTGALQRKSGMFELANGGTIFLDEIGDMDVRLQPKLLQVLQDHEFHRIGGKELIKVDVRIMAATHRDLEQAIVARNFREDLYYRLNVITVNLPPLRERPEDILPLAEFLLARHAGNQERQGLLTKDLKHALTVYHWPGNVRELENIIRKLLILSNPDQLARELHTRAAKKVIALQPAPTVEPSVEDVQPQPAQARLPVLEQVTKAKQLAEAQAIITALNTTKWNRKEAAKILNIDYKALLYKMKKLGVEANSLGAVPRNPS
jgi:two-component system response regulator AtoC